MSIILDDVQSLWTYSSQQNELSIIVDCREYNLILTSSACPEQYDVLLYQIKCGYVRLRNGHFTARIVKNDEIDFSDIVYESCTLGDGMFEPEERYKHLYNAVAAIHSFWKEQEK